jgi:hypothetical protein
MTGSDNQPLNANGIDVHPRALLFVCTHNVNAIYAVAGLNSAF